MATSSFLSVQTKHKQFAEKESSWMKMRDSMEGQDKIKKRSTLYLPMPPAIKISDSTMAAQNKYNFYLSFAEFPEIVQPTIDGIQGLIHSKPPKFELPPQIAYMEEKSTNDGKSLMALWEDVTREILITGRIGLLSDFQDSTGQQGPIPDDVENNLLNRNIANAEAGLLNFTINNAGAYTPSSNVYLSQYSAECIINWRKKNFNSGSQASMIVLHEKIEQPNETNPFENESADLYRVLRYDFSTNFQYTQQLYLFNDNQEDFSISDEFVVQRIGRTFDENIPFVVINSINLELDIGPIPFLPMVNKALDIYKKSASYNRALYLVGDPTVVRTGITPEESEMYDFIGGGHTWDFENPDAKAELLELKGQSIPHVRQAMQDDREEAERIIGRLMDNKGGVETAEALKIRQSTKQISIKSIIKNAGKGLEKALRNCAKIMGGNPDLVLFEPNLDFAEVMMSADDLVKFVTAKNSGAPMSQETLHDLMVKGGVTRKQFDDEIDEMMSEGIVSGNVMGNENPIVDDEQNDDGAPQN